MSTNEPLPPTAFFVICGDPRRDGRDYVLDVDSQLVSYATGDIRSLRDNCASYTVRILKRLGKYNMVSMVRLTVSLRCKCNTCRDFCQKNLKYSSLYLVGA